VNSILGKRPTLAWCLTAGFGLFCLGVIVLANFSATYPMFIASVRQLPGGDKTAHFLLVGVLALLLNSAMNAATVRVAGLTFLKGNLILVLLATLEELSNLIQPGRTYSLLDLQFNYLGIFAFGWMSLWFAKRQARVIHHPM
jgi:hypothetical protein